MPELPEMEAWRRQLDGPVSAFPIAKAGPAHIATLKTYDPPLATLDGRRFRGAERRAKRMLFPTDDGELVLMVHLMSAGRLRYVRPGGQGTEDARAAAALRGRRGAAADRGRPEEARGRLAATGRSNSRRNWRTSAPRRSGSAPSGWARSCAPTAASCTRSCATSARSPASAAPGRTRSSTRRGSRRSSSRRTSSDEEVERLAASIDEELARGLELRERGKKDEAVYRVHNRLGEPCHVCGEPLRRVDYEEHTVYYCPACQTGGKVLKDRRLSRLLR